MAWNSVLRHAVHPNLRAYAASIRRSVTGFAWWQGHRRQRKAKYGISICRQRSRRRAASSTITASSRSTCLKCERRMST